MSKEELRLIPINPFTERQRQIIGCALRGKSSIEEIADELGIARETVKHHIGGKDDQSLKPTISQLGIYGIIEQFYGTRPHRLAEAIGMLMGDLIVSNVAPPEIRANILQKSIELGLFPIANNTDLK